MQIVPVSFRDACDFVKRHHRHHGSPVGHKFSLAVEEAGQVVGVAIAGRPVARQLDDGLTLEITRVCCLAGVKNCCSMLYGAARRIAREMGYRRVVTYTLAAEPGTSLKASGWTCVADVRGKSWNCPSRPRKEGQSEPKRRWECPLNPGR